MKFETFKFVYISLDYLRAMHEIDSEIFFKDSSDYEKKPHLGILINHEGREYVIPLTSAKEKHKNWKDVTSTNYLIYEIINMENTKVDDDIIVDITNKELLKKKNVSETDYPKYKKRILSVVEIKKMFPVKHGVYREVELKNEDNLCVDELQRRRLMSKEYRFCLDIRQGLEEKATKIYQK